MLNYEYLNACILNYYCTISLCPYSSVTKWTLQNLNENFSAVAKKRHVVTRGVHYTGSPMGFPWEWESLS